MIEFNCIFFWQGCLLHYFVVWYFHYLSCLHIWYFWHVYHYGKILFHIEEFQQTFLAYPILLQLLIWSTYFLMDWKYIESDNMKDFSENDHGLHIKFWNVFEIKQPSWHIQSLKYVIEILYYTSIEIRESINETLDCVTVFRCYALSILRMSSKMKVNTERSRKGLG